MTEFEFKNYKFPETDEEILANRKTFLKALLTEPKDAQCFGQLYLAPGETGEDGDKVAKHRRCAVGLAGDVFFGVTTAEQLEAFNYVLAGESDGNVDLYVAVGKMLGIDDDSDSEMSIVDIYSMNDDNRDSFEMIARELGDEWKVQA